VGILLGGPKLDDGAADVFAEIEAERKADLGRAVDLEAEHEAVKHDEHPAHKRQRGKPETGLTEREDLKVRCSHSGLSWVNVVGLRAAHRLSGLCPHGGAVSVADECDSEPVIGG
jgi:hypothetical protein